MRRPLDKADIDAAKGRSVVWDLANKWLYSLCRRYPKHERGEEIAAKVLLIGRTYAAAIERRQQTNGQLVRATDDFYEEEVVPAVMTSGIDDWLNSLPRRLSDPWAQLSQVVLVHGKVTGLFRRISNLGKRSLASKYLHFHRPDLFFIYDSRARRGLATIQVHPTYLRGLKAKGNEVDGEYQAFVAGCQAVRDCVQATFGEALSPREVDNLMLHFEATSRDQREVGQALPAAHCDGRWRRR